MSDGNGIPPRLSARPISPIKTTATKGDGKMRSCGFKTDCCGW
jgi:hypothetical protein